MVYRGWLKMNETTQQLERTGDLYCTLKGENFREFVQFINQIKRNRTLSSLEEELVTQLPLSDKEEQKQIQEQAEKIIKAKGIDTTKVIDLRVLEKEDPKLAKKITEIGLLNFQYMMQANFYDQAKTAGLFTLDSDYLFDAGYEKRSHGKLSGLKFRAFDRNTKSRQVSLGDNLNIAVIEEYKYGGTLAYRSVLYHLLRHMTNIHGQETSDEISQRARQAFSGKKVLELGCGPGFFLYSLRKLGAEVTGVEESEKYRKNTQEAGLNIVYGDATNLADLVKGEFDVVFSRDFLSFGVTKDYADLIMKEALKVTRKNSLSFHSVDYSRTSEEKYLEYIKKSMPESMQKSFAENFNNMSVEQREFILRRNIFNISPDHLKSLGYTSLTGFKLDCEENLSIALTK